MAQLLIVNIDCHFPRWAVWLGVGLACVGLPIGAAARVIVFFARIRLRPVPA